MRVVSYMLALLTIHPLIWQQIAPFSDYIGFDPDLRELQERQDRNLFGRDNAAQLDHSQ